MEPVWKGDDMGVVMSEIWREQREIGLINLFKGQISKKWETAQTLFYKEFPHRKN